MITRTTGRAGQQHARSSSYGGEDHRLGSGGAPPDSGALPPARMCGNLRLIIQASPGRAHAVGTYVPLHRAKEAPAARALGAAAPGTIDMPSITRHRRLELKRIGDISHQSSVAVGTPCGVKIARGWPAVAGWGSLPRPWRGGRAWCRPEPPAPGAGWLPGWAWPSADVVDPWRA